MSAVLKACLPHEETHSVVLPTGKLRMQVQDSQLPVADLMGFAARANAKRGFLFVSKVLGKHWPVKPTIMQDIHERLARQVPASIDGPVVFIAMAETAIGLGQGMFEAYLRAHPGCRALFLHTTRYQVGDLPIVEFEESHSHAPRQFLHLPQDQCAKEIFFSAQSLIMIDDEASTGNTFVNLASAYRRLNGNVCSIHLSVITNFMGASATRSLPQRFGCDVTMGAILQGGFSFAAGDLKPAETPAQLFESNVDRGASGAFGRLGLTGCQNAPMELAGKLIKEILPREKVLVLGTGEFMHSAFLLGRELQTNGIDVVVQSTTRSPILEGGAIGRSLRFADNYGEGIANFVYNVAPGQYDHVLICHETPVNAGLGELAALLNARLFRFRSETHIEEYSIR